MLRRAISHVYSFVQDRAILYNATQGFAITVYWGSNAMRDRRQKPLKGEQAENRNDLPDCYAKTLGTISTSSNHLQIHENTALERSRA